MAKIIDNNLYFPLAQATLTTPQKFNAIFDSINANALGSHNYIPPSSIGVSTNYIYYGETGSDLSPYEITFADTTALPTSFDGSDAVNLPNYTWTLESGGSASVTGYKLTGSTSGDEISTVAVEFDPTDDGSTNAVDETGSVVVKCVAIYSDGTNTITRTSYAGLPFSQRGADGSDALQATQAMIYCNAAHQNLRYPDGYVTFEAKSKSLAIPSASLTYVWTLHEVDSSGSLSTDQSAWIYSNADWTGGTNATTQNAYIKSTGTAGEHANKRFRLTLEATGSSGGVDTTTIDLFSYHYGTFFYSWGASTVQAPDSVTLEAAEFSDASFFLPEPKGSIKVKWGMDGPDIQIGNNIWTANGVDDFNPLQAILTAKGWNEEDPAQYSLLRCSNIGEGADVINRYFWVHPMNSSAKIVSKLDAAEIAVANVATFTSTAFGGASIADTDHIYLLQGTTPSAIFDVAPGNTKATIGPDAEKYFVYLSEYTDAGATTYSGTRDQSAVVISKGSGTYAAAPAEVSYTFTNVYKDGFFKGEVVANKMGSYSSKISSAAALQISSESGVGVPRAIASGNPTVSEVGSSSITLNIGLASDGGDDPVGYLIAYKEVAVTSSNDGSNAVTFLAAPFDATSIAWTVLYTSSSNPKILGNIGRKLIGAVQAIGPNGAKGTGVIFPATTVQVDSSLDMTGLSKHLGRRRFTPSAEEYMDSIPTDIAGNKGYPMCVTSFGRDVYIEQLNVIGWFKDDGTGASDTLEVQLQVEDQQDHKEISVVLPETVTLGSDKGVLLYDGDLSVPVPAGKKLYILLNDPDAPTTAAALTGSTYEFEVEVYFAHAATGSGTGDGTQ